MSDGQTQICEQISADDKELLDTWEKNLSWKAACIGDYILENLELSNAEKMQIEKHLNICVRIIDDHNERKTVRNG